MSSHSPAVVALLCSWKTERERSIVLYVNTVDPAEVKIVHSSILSQQRQRAAQPKTIFGHGSRCPQTSPVRTGLRGELLALPNSEKRVADQLETMCFKRTLTRESTCVCWYSNWRHLMGRFTDDEEPVSLN